MRLLSPEDVSSHKAETKLSTASINRSIAEENRKLAHDLNELRRQEQEERARISAETTVFIAEENRKRDEAKREVEAIEARRRDALKPITEERDRVEERERAVTERERAVNEAEYDIKNTREKLRDEWDIIAEWVDALNERANKLDEREKKVGSEESHSKQSAQNLAEKWIDFHNQVHKANVDLAERTRVVADQVTANETIRLALDAQKQEQTEKERQIADKYATLARASAEILKKNKSNP